MVSQKFNDLKIKHLTGLFRLLLNMFFREILIISYWYFDGHFLIAWLAIWIFQLVKIPSKQQFYIFDLFFTIFRWKIVIFYTEILMRKDVLWCFFTSKMSGKNPQFNFSRQNLSLERNFFKWDGKVTKIMTPTFP